MTKELLTLEGSICYSLTPLIPRPAVYRSFVNSASGDEIKQFIHGFVKTGAIPKYGVPDVVVVVDTIARTSVGKLNKKELREQYRDHPDKMVAKLSKFYYFSN